MTRLCLIALLALMSCSPVAPQTRAAGSGISACRVGQDGARPLPDPPLTRPPLTRLPLADRGIGGTGGPAAPMADRGIGGTGIIGVITGFASLCVDGEEVALADHAAVEVDGASASLADLRAGQVVSLRASGRPGSLRTQAVAVRHLAIGPVAAVGQGRMTVAGQLVLTVQADGAAIAAKPGEWVAVSGLRDPAGAIAATRIDPAPAGLVLLHGMLDRKPGPAHIGTMPVRLPDDGKLPVAGSVTVAGRLRDGELIADSVTPDAAAEGPAELFGGGVENFIVEAYVVEVAGGYLVGRDVVRGGNPGGVEQGSLGIASFTRQAGGALVLNGVRSAGQPLGALGGGQGGGPAGANPAAGGLSGGFSPGNTPFGSGPSQPARGQAGPGAGQGLSDPGAEGQGAQGQGFQGQGPQGRGVGGLGAGGPGAGQGPHARGMP